MSSLTRLFASVLFLGVAVAPVQAQLEKVEHKPVPAGMVDFGDLAEGPFDSLVIRNVMVLPGHGGPATGPYDLLITGNVIAEMRQFDPVVAARREAAGETVARLTGSHIIEGEGKYVMPGMLNLHLHLRGEALPLDYIFYMQLATGVTSIGPAEEGRVRDILEAERNNEILAPRLFPIYGWGSTTSFTEEERRDPAMAPQIAEAMIANGVRQVYLNDLCWNAELFGAAAKAVEAAGGITAVHIQPSSTSVVNALDAARLGVTMIVHHYGYAESALPRGVQNYPTDYNYLDENIRFREAAQVWIEVGENPESKERLLTTVVDSLVHYGGHDAAEPGDL